jgi:hypothetical protein
MYMYGPVRLSDVGGGYVYSELDVVGYECLEFVERSVTVLSDDEDRARNKS